jgi:hypothetical protein
VKFNLKIVYGSESLTKLEMNVSKVIEPVVQKFFESAQKPFVDYLRDHLPADDADLAFLNEAHSQFLHSTLSLMTRFSIFFKFMVPDLDIALEVSELFKKGQEQFAKDIILIRLTHDDFNTFNQKQIIISHGHFYEEVLDSKSLELDFYFNNLIYRTLNHVLASLDEPQIRAVYLNAMIHAFKTALWVDKVIDDKVIEKINDEIVTIVI